MAKSARASFAGGTEAGAGAGAGAGGDANDADLKIESSRAIPPLAGDKVAGNGGSAGAGGDEALDANSMSKAGIDVDGGGAGTDCGTDRGSDALDAPNSMSSGIDCFSGRVDDGGGGAAVFVTCAQILLMAKVSYEGLCRRTCAREPALTPASDDTGRFDLSLRRSKSLSLALESKTEHQDSWLVSLCLGH